jgi:hypothetical protein
LLSLLGGVIGVILAAVAVYLLRSLMPAGISQADLVGIDFRVLGFTLLISLVTGIVFGLAPITQASNFNLNETLKEGGRDSSAGSRGHRTGSDLSRFAHRRRAACEQLHPALKYEPWIPD